MREKIELAERQIASIITKLEQDIEMDVVELIIEPVDDNYKGMKDPKINFVFSRK